MGASDTMSINNSILGQSPRLARLLEEIRHLLDLIRRAPLFS
jgi:hypothetical protein